MNAPAELPLSPLVWVNRFASLGPAFFTELPAQGLPEPHWVAHSEDAARLLGWPADWWQRMPDALAVFSGQAQWPGMRPLASVYSGHQFGVWAGPAGRWPRAAAGRGRGSRRAAGAAAQGCRANALFAHGRRPRGAALVHPRVPVFGGHAPPGRADVARTVPDRLGAAGATRNRGNRGGGDPPGPQLHPLRSLRALQPPRSAPGPAPAVRLRHSALLP